MSMARTARRPDDVIHGMPVPDATCSVRVGGADDDRERAAPQRFAAWAGVCTRPHGNDGWGRLAFCVGGVVGTVGDQAAEIARHGGADLDRRHRAASTPRASPISEQSVGEAPADLMAEIRAATGTNRGRRRDRPRRYRRQRRKSARWRLKRLA